MTLRNMLFILLLSLVAMPTMAAEDGQADGQQTTADGQQDGKGKQEAGDGDEEPECD